MRALLYLLAVGLLLAGCTLVVATTRLPTAQRHWQMPPSTATTQLFDCTAQVLEHLRAESSSWQPVSRRDEQAGVLETGHYQQRNRTGFRLRLQHQRVEGAARMDLRGAGAWFFDLGVEAAADQLQTGIAACLD